MKRSIPGTHWLLEIVGLILTDGYPEKMDRRLYGSCAEMIDISQNIRCPKKKRKRIQSI